MENCAALNTVAHCSYRLAAAGARLGHFRIYFEYSQNIPEYILTKFCEASLVRSSLQLAKRAPYTSFVDLQMAYNTVQHDLLWGGLRQFGVIPGMLAAVQSLYATGTLAMGVLQGCPLSPTLFGLVFDWMHDYLLAWAPVVGMQLRSRRWVSLLEYAGNDVLVSISSWTSPSDSHGLQHLSAGMHQYCLSLSCHGMGLIVSPTNIEVAVFHWQLLESELTCKCKLTGSL